jgi:hypothetical protein
LLQNPDIKVFIRGNAGDGDLQGVKWWLNEKLVPATELMSARALAIYKFLLKQSVSPNQIKHGQGEIKPGSDGYNVTFELKRD